MTGKIKTHFPVSLAARNSYCKYGTMVHNLEVRQVSPCCILALYHLYNGIKMSLYNSILFSSLSIAFFSLSSSISIIVQSRKSLLVFQGNLMNKHDWKGWVGEDLPLDCCFWGYLTLVTIWNLGNFCCFYIHHCYFMLLILV